jgi:hypothetical protein
VIFHGKIGHLSGGRGRSGGLPWWFDTVPGEKLFDLSLPKALVLGVLVIAIFGPGAVARIAGPAAPRSA